MNSTTTTIPPSLSAKADEATRPKVRVRERILDTARQLFYRNGLRAVGVEAIASEAGTNKMSFYRCFPSKDELIAEYLRDQGREYWTWWDKAVAPHEGDARKQIEALFDTYMTLTCKDSSRGCALGNAVVELPEGDHPGRTVVREHKSEMRGRLRKLAKDAGAVDANTLGDALMLIMEGGYLSRLSFCSQGPVQVAGKAVRTLLDAYLPATTVKHKTVSSRKRSS